MSVCCACLSTRPALPTCLAAGILWEGLPGATALRMGPSHTQAP